MKQLLASPKQPKGVRVVSVAAGSCAAQKGIEAGGRILAINGSPVRDEIDLLFLAADARLKITYQPPLLGVREPCSRLRDGKPGVLLGGGKRPPSTSAAGGKQGASMACALQNETFGNSRAAAPRDTCLKAHTAASRDSAITETAGVPREIVIVKPPDAPLGIEIEPIRPRGCRNKCVFCFIDQNPPHLRRPLYFKDEDFRLSFTHGHYITATNLTRADLDRIAGQRLSPLYISVHATPHELRCRMLGVNPAKTPDLLDVLRFLADRRIEFHAQIVLCPGWNDGAALERTLDDLESFLPALLSVAVVPVGLTVHREGLPRLEPVTPRLAGEVIAQVQPRQKRLRRKLGHRIALLADEFYLLAGAEPPRYTPDEISSQIENGVGMIADFWQGWPSRATTTAYARAATANAAIRAGSATRSIPKSPAQPRKVAILTGLLGARVLEPLVTRLSRIKGLDLRVIALENSLYGRGVTVSGLLPGADFERGLESAHAEGADLVLLPGNALRPHDNRFLDDLLLDDLQARHPSIRVQVIHGGACDILAAVTHSPHHRDTGTQRDK
jgi:putative radical SAM enzyme (TIGR03279 family)